MLAIDWPVNEVHSTQFHYMPSFEHVELNACSSSLSTYRYCGIYCLFLKGSLRRNGAFNPFSHREYVEELKTRLGCTKDMNHTTLFHAV